MVNNITSPIFTNFNFEEEIKFFDKQPNTPVLRDVVNSITSPIFTNFNFEEEIEFFDKGQNTPTPPDNEEVSFVREHIPYYGQLLTETHTILDTPRISLIRMPQSSMEFNKLRRCQNIDVTRQLICPPYKPPTDTINPDKLHINSLNVDDINVEIPDDKAVFLHPTLDCLFEMLH